MSFERVGGEVVYEGRIGKVRMDKFRHDDGEVVQREVIDHPGASVMLPLDGDRIWLVRQPREVVGEQALLELPAGKLNGVEPLETAKRELREEIGKSAATWEHLHDLLCEPGIHGRADLRVPRDRPHGRPARGRGGGAHRDRVRAAVAARRRDPRVRGREEPRDVAVVPRVSSVDA